MRAKVTVVGAGMVGATTAQYLAHRDIADIVLVDIVENLPQGKALDLTQAGPVIGYDSAITGANDYEPTENSDVVVITSGSPRKPGMSRDDLLRINMNIVRAVTGQVVPRSPYAVIVVVTNPLDAMCHVALEASGFPPARVLGQAGVLDSARFRAFVAMELNVSPKDVTAFVLGGHGDTMVPVPRLSTVAGIPIPELLPAERIDAIVERTRDGGGEIVRLLGTSAYYAPAASTADMVEAILLDQNRILPASVRLTGQFGIDGLYVGVPIKLGAGGVKQVIEVALTDQELNALHRSASAVRELVEAMKNL
ncbi:malate dehydrogenase [Nitrolancea hollandica]|uniref:Malate dehydrogenase n=1 Tax=Nitrolancea hollandica Lb TaxID=1129897 RepID=I4ECR3_9BACT|nr:malate dehydrogenase [Nitrolancea hollandica]CCF82475.1 Malate dehydrogenase, NAD-dependent [Nitrolancea hollandica Lb]